MKKVLVTIPFNDDQKERLMNAYGDVEVSFTEGSAVTSETLDKVDALIGNVSTDLLKGKTNLQWVQLNSSGADAYAKPGVVPENTVLTCATGAYGLAISEYMVGMLMVMMKKVPGYIECQKAGEWKPLGPVKSPYGKRVLLVGTGNIGLEFAKRMKAFGCTLVGVRNRADVCPAELDEIHSVAELKEQVAMADVIALSLPGTDACYHLFNREILSSCKEGAYLMNVGRGTAIDTAVLLDEAVSSRFGGIWLDVCEVEPLPANDPLFFVTNMLITPHITGGYNLAETTENILDITLQNMKAWHDDGKFVHLVSRKDGYSLG